MSLRLPIAAISGALLTAGALVLLSCAPAVAVSTTTGSGTGTILTQGTALSHGGGQPESVVVAGSDVYVANYGNDAVDVYNEATGAFVTSLGLGGAPISLAVTADGSKVYVADQGADIEAINTSDNTINFASTFPLSDQPVSIALSPSGSTIYVLFNGSQQVSSYNLAGGLLHTSTTSGITTGFHVAVSQDGGTVYVTYRDSAPSGGDGGLAVLDANLNTITDLDVPSASGLGLSPDGADLFIGGTVPVTFVGHVADLSVATNTPTGGDAVVPQDPESLVASPNGGWVYAASPSEGDISVVDRSTFTATTEGSTGATAIAISPDGLHLYVADAGNGHTDVFSIAQVTVSADAAVAPGTASTPFTVSVADGNPVVGDYSADTVTVNLYDASNTLVASSSSVPMTATGTITVPVDTSALPIGVYHATATLTDSVDGTQTSATATGFAVRAVLATTGVDAEGPVVLGVLLLAAGLLLFAGRTAARRRRSTI
jgi:DNA-binding beta-propeller fold protein YncE